MTILHCRYGDFSVPDRNDLIFNALREYGEWGQEELDMLSRFVRPGDTVLDIGGFIGTHARAFSQMVGAQGIVHTFEPNERIYCELFTNAQLAPYSNIKTYQIALGFRKQKRFLLQGDLIGNLGASQIIEDDRGASTTVIEEESLDDLDFSCIDFIKVDVEGMERNVVIGGIRAIRQHAPVVFLEANSLEASGRIIDLAHRIKYVVFGHISRAFNPDNFNRSTTNMFGEARECGLLLIHRDRLDTWQNTLSTLQLPVIETIDDLALMLLHKPQYVHEVLGGAEALEQIANVNQAVTERDGQIANLNQAVTERDGQIANLNQAVTERDGEYEQIIRSKSWLITKPFRWLGRVLRGEFEAALDPLKKMQKPNDKVAKGQQDSSRVNEIQYEVLGVPLKPTNPVAVILPVYRDVEMTKRCILAAMPSVLSDPNAKFLAIDDASPSEGMQEMLKQLSLKWPNKFLLLKNEKNLGFVRTVNRGLAHFSEYDVVLLNSDVIVPQDWLSRLVDEAYSIANAGTVTPFSNNATICSFPYFLQNNAQPFDLDVDVIDAVFRQKKLPCI